MKSAFLTPPNLILAPRKNYFITGTDTEVGKTFMTRQLLNQLCALGYTTNAIKPIASGATRTTNGLRHQDAVQLQAAATVKQAYQRINPFCFEPPIAPHIAARLSGQALTANAVTHAMTHALQREADYHFIEGAGGWYLPLNDHETLVDALIPLSVQVILVVKMQLGCLNHAILTARAIQASRFHLAAWIPNTIDHPMPYLKENIAALQSYLHAPCLAFKDVIVNQV